MLHLHRAERADALVDALGTVLAEPLPDPFAPDVIAIPTRGMERWLTQRLSAHLGASAGRGDGIVANVGFPSLRTLVDEAVAAAIALPADADAWQPGRMVWPLLDVVDGALGEDWLRLLADHLENSVGGLEEDETARRLSAVRHIAGLYDRYALYRPQMLRSWLAGEDCDASGRRLNDAALWQAELWRRLRRTIGQPGPAERTDAAADALIMDPTLSDLPPRLSLFGLTRLPARQLQVLRALSVGRDVHLFLLHPSLALWDRIAASSSPPSDAPVRRADDLTRTLPRNRLLESWGSDARELQLVASGHYVDHPAPLADAPASLLGLIQRDVRADVAPPGAPLPGAPDTRPVLADDDTSIQIHSCHGRARQVEVLRDAILHLLQEDRTLQPRDVIVMCPDIEAFAPLIQATFGAGEIDADGELALPDEVRPPDLRVRLADRSLRQTNPVLGTVSRLLELADQRLTASQVLDLADRGPVRRRFGFDDDDLSRIEDWVSDSGVRWGLDPAHRTPFKLTNVPFNTWRSGLDRVLLGVAMTEDDQRLVGDVLPLDDVESGAIDLAGRFAELVDRLATIADAFAVAKTLPAWTAAIGEAADALTACAPRDGWQRAELDRMLGDLTAEAAVGGRGSLIELAEIRALLADRLAGRPTRANFRTGHLTICTLVPMRSVPHRVVCLLGLDDGVFPRRSPRDGDDLLVEDPHVGDHDSRAEDRQMLLDALLAATDRLVITYTGNDERTNAVKPPAVPVGELLDMADRTVQVDDVRERLVRRHKLQPFDPENFAADAPWSFDRITLAGAQALAASERTATGPFLPGPLPPLTSPVVELDELIRFVGHPVKAFLRGRLGISLTDISEELRDALPIELDALEKWGVGDRILRALLAGGTIQAAVAAERARGDLPPGRLGQRAVEEAAETASAIFGQAATHFSRTHDLGSLDVNLVLPDGRRFSGTVAGVCDDRLQAVQYSRVRAKHRIEAWVRLLAATVAHPELALSAMTIGRSATRGRKVDAVRLGPVPVEDAWAALTDLIELYDRGMREPAPVSCAAGAAYAAAALHDRPVLKAVENEWKSAYTFDKEDREPEHLLAFGGELTVEDLLTGVPREDEKGPGWDEHQHSRFGRWAVRIWKPLLDAEEVASR